MFGMHSVYLLGLLFGFTLIGQVILQDSYQHEAAKFLEDYTQIIEGTLEPKQVVFYTRYSGMGEHYFNMRLERMPDGSMRILEIVRRYMD